MSPIGKCECGCQAVLLKKVVYPPSWRGELEQRFCDGRCSKFLEAKKAAGKAWELYRSEQKKNYKNGELGRQQAALARGKKLPQAEQQRRKLDRAAADLARRDKVRGQGQKGPAYGGGSSRKALQAARRRQRQ